MSVCLMFKNERGGATGAATGAGGGGGAGAGGGGGGLRKEMIRCNHLKGFPTKQAKLAYGGGIGGLFKHQNTS